MSSPDRILVFSPHPDDVELFLGGTLLKHVHHGDTVRVVMMTRGEKGSLLSLLGNGRQEALKCVRDAELAERYLRIPSVELSHLDLPDMGVTDSAENINRALDCLGAFEPDLIYLPESHKAMSLYTHPDHLATGRIVEAARQRSSRPLQLRYFHTRQPDVFVDVTDYHKENVKALRCYTSQYGATAAPPYLLHLLEWERFRRTRKNGNRIGVRFAEGFRETRGDTRSRG